jgi:hypothetical protein
VNYTLISEEFMSKFIKPKKKKGKAILCFLLVSLTTTVILLSAVIGAAFVIAMGPSRSVSERLCATFAEKNYPMAGLFFSEHELRDAVFYMPPEVVQSDLEQKNTKKYKIALHYIDDASYAWDAVVMTGIDPASLSLERGSRSALDSDYAFGLCGDPDAYIVGDYLSYRGNEDEIYCFCAMNADGILEVGARTAYEAANSGYVWGISVDRVLMQNSMPASDLGGGYASRVAIGQAADGSIILVFANDRGIYPAGITYDELVAIMFEYGAVNAAAIRAEGAFYSDGVGQLGSKSENGFTLSVEGGAD